MARMKVTIIMARKSIPITTIMTTKVTMGLMRHMSTIIMATVHMTITDIW
ncbi:hypothetical protein [Salinicoccus roseus]|nr:hypothetical protein [Salinicoccus roseus]GGA75680.1 hypothetical protein GCM10007176_19970 [Salinicoccus roseus]